MGLDQYFYTTSKELVDDIRSVYNAGHRPTIEFVVDHLFDYKEDEFYQRKNWPLDSILINRCQPLVGNDDSVYVIPKEIIKELLKVKRFSDMSKEDSNRVVYAVQTLASIYDELNDMATMLYLRSY